MCKGTRIATYKWVVFLERLPCHTCQVYDLVKGQIIPISFVADPGNPFFANNPIHVDDNSPGKSSKKLKRFLALADVVSHRKAVCFIKPPLKLGKEFSKLPLTVSRRYSRHCRYIEMASLTQGYGDVSFLGRVTLTIMNTPKQS